MNGETLHDALCRIDDDLIEAVAVLRERGPAGQRIPWMRWTSLAACFCILAGGILVWSRMYGGYTGRMETAASAETMAGVTTEAAPEEGIDEGVYGTEGMQENMAVPETESIEEGITEGAPRFPETVLQEFVPENVQYIRTDGYCEDAVYPAVTLIRTRDELDTYYEANRDLYDLAAVETVYADTSIGFADAMERYDTAYFTENDLLLVLVEEDSGSIRHTAGALTETEEGWAVDIIAIEPERCTDDTAQWHILIEVEKDLIAPDDAIWVE
ncbi:MAG: hypothetical protein IJX14_05050 [Clostridia bacterium]|nr:hypothetical protein [Clostridia bacterium]